MTRGEDGTARQGAKALLSCRRGHLGRVADSPGQRENSARVDPRASSFPS
jgi:hypothetical protein